MKREIQLTLIVLMFSTAHSVDHRYCYLESCPNYTHTLCQFSESRLGENCEIAITYELTEHERLSIVRKYNSNRPKVKLYELPENSESQAEPMNAVTLDYWVHWDTELARIAQRWANQCMNETDTCRNVARFHVQQRVGKIKTFIYNRNPSIEPLITKWANEDRLTPMDSLNFENLSFSEAATVVSNYHLEMMKPRATKIGCALLRTMDKIFRYVYLVCNYGPA